MLYMYALPRAFPDVFSGVDLAGRLVYREHEVEVPPDAVNEAFVAKLSSFMARLSRDAPAMKRRASTF